MKFSSILAASVVLGAAMSSASADVIVTGIMDGDLTGGTPKVIELYINGTEDLANYTLERSSNGGVFGTSTALSGVYTDAFVYLVGTGDSLANFQAMFGTFGDFANTFVTGTVNGNGDDGFRIVDAGLNVVDQVWTEDTTDAYLDSYMYRIDGTGPDGGWNASNWLIPGNSVLDTLTLEEQAALVPFGTYQIPAPGALALLGVAGLVGVRRRRA
ncbi:MAG: hypothetical protein KC983_01775 [Phycisphaerales bacterium]|nr:hypothetical protein [Phycisphaerales bacterium]